MNLCQNTVWDTDVSKSLVDVVNFQNKKSSFRYVTQFSLKPSNRNLLCIFKKTLKIILAKFQLSFSIVKTYFPSFQKN